MRRCPRLHTAAEDEEAFFVCDDPTAIEPDSLVAASRVVSASSHVRFHRSSASRRVLVRNFVTRRGEEQYRRSYVHLIPPRNRSNLGEDLPADWTTCDRDLAEIRWVLLPSPPRGHVSTGLDGLSGSGLARR